LHRFDTAHECDRRTDGQTDRRPDDGKDARSILLSRVKIHSVSQLGSYSSGSSSLTRLILYYRA